MPDKSCLSACLAGIPPAPEPATAYSLTWVCGIWSLLRERLSPFDLRLHGGAELAVLAHTG